MAVLLVVLVEKAHILAVAFCQSVVVVLLAALIKLGAWWLWQVADQWRSCN